MKRFNFYLQLVAVFTVAVLYLWGMPGLVWHFFLGIIQLLSAFVVLAQLRTLSETLRVRLLIYWALVAITAISFYLAFTLSLNEIWLTATMVFTGLIAIYYTWFSYSLMTGAFRRRRGNFSILDFPTE